MMLFVARPWRVIREISQTKSIKRMIELKELFVVLLHILNRRMEQTCL